MPIYLQAAGWPVICSVSCSLNNIVSNALIVDDILALVLGTDAAWPQLGLHPKKKKKKIVTLYFFLYLLGGNLLLDICWFCHKWSVSDITGAAVREVRVQVTPLVNLRGVQQMHMLTLWSLFRGNVLVRLAAFVWTKYSELPTRFPVFWVVFRWTYKTAVHTEFYYQRVWCLFWLCSWYFFWLCSNEWIYF